MSCSMAKGLFFSFSSSVFLRPTSKVCLTKVHGLSSLEKYIEDITDQLVSAWNVSRAKFQPIRQLFCVIIISVKANVGKGKQTVLDP